MTVFAEQYPGNEKPGYHEEDVNTDEAARDSRDMGVIEDDE